MGRKKSERKTSMLRVYVEFGEKVRRAAMARGLTIAEFCERHMTEAVERSHRDWIEAEARRLRGDPD